MSEKTIERNDIDISNLFKWKSVLELKDIDDNIIKTVYMRIIGDAELNRARVSSMRASAEMRSKLRDTTSDEYIAYIPSIDQFEKENIAEMLLSLDMRRYAEQVEKTIKVPMPKKLSSDASLEEQEIHQRAIDDYPQFRQKKIKDALTKLVEEERKKLNRTSVENLITKYRQLVSDQLCEIELNRTFIGMSVVFGTFDDEKCTEKTFSSFDEYENLPPYAKEQFIEHYYNLQLGVSDLKK